MNKGILGPIMGKVGTVIGSSWKGITYLRSLSSTRQTTFSQAQLTQQAKFAMVINFLKPMTPLLSFSFDDYAKRMSGFNNAMAYTYRNAIAGGYPDFTINYPLALVSRGSLPNAESIGVQKDGTAPAVLFSWEENSGAGTAKADDDALLVVYCPALNECVYQTVGVRSTESAAILVSRFQNRVVHTYLAFISKDRKEISNSYYAGSVNLA